MNKEEKHKKAIEKRMKWYDEMLRKGILKLRRKDK